MTGRPTHTQSDILIVGGGPVGMALAIALSRSEFSVAMAAPAPKRDGPAVAISAGCWRLLHRIGVAEAMRDEAQPIARVEADGGCGALMATADDLPGNAGEEPLGFVVARTALTDALESGVAAGDVLRIRGPATWRTPALDGGTAICHTGDGTAHRARLVIACDGAGSSFRTAAGIGETTRRHNAAAMVFYLETRHRGVARQVFTPTGPAAMLPMTAGRACIVWTETKTRARALMALDERDFWREFAPVASDLVRAPHDIDPSQPKRSYPIRMRFSERLHGPRLALAGDAARVIHPLAGQGLNLGLKDVAALCHVLQDARRTGLDIGSDGVLRDYDRRRRADSACMIVATEALAAAFTAPAPVRALAATSLALCGAIPLLRRCVVANAGSVLGGLPRLLQPLEP